MRFLRFVFILSCICLSACCCKHSCKSISCSDAPKTVASTIEVDLSKASTNTKAFLSKLKSEGGTFPSERTKSQYVLTESEDSWLVTGTVKVVENGPEEFSNKKIKVRSSIGQQRTFTAPVSLVEELLSYEYVIYVQLDSPKSSLK